ncbi:MAG TPA: choice-of-anchor V domain-containing protein [Rhodothermales bacterium]|nr:choice-of-anchor V domain-containing protein [Rhodothermales bacterium]
MFETRALLLVVALAAAVPGLAQLYRDGPPVHYTGGYGEPTCHVCHFDGMLNSPDANARAIDVPSTFVSDSTYPITVVVSKAALGAAGFSMSSRFRSGAQAGSFLATDERATVESGPTGVQFAMHTLDGSDPVAPDSTAWTLAWTAPSEADTVFFHVAANAANGDDSEFGDLIETVSYFSLGAAR